MYIQPLIILLYIYSIIVIQLKKKKKANLIIPKNKVLISNNYSRKGITLYPKLGKIGKRLIPGIVTVEGGLISDF